MKILLEEKILEKQAKKKSKFYWILETITGKTEASVESEDFDLISSETGYLQDIKEEILESILKMFSALLTSQKKAIISPSKTI